MNSKKLLILASLLTIATGIIISIISIALGQMQMMLFLIFPVFYAEGLVPAIGIALLFIGFAALFLSTIISAAGGGARSYPDEESFDDIKVRERQKPEMKAGGVVLIGPIPIVFGSNWKIAIAAMILAIFLVGLMLLFLL